MQAASEPIIPVARLLGPVTQWLSVAPGWQLLQPKTHAGPGHKKGVNPHNIPAFTGTDETRNYYRKISQLFLFDVSLVKTLRVFFQMEQRGFLLLKGWS